ncbi:MAG: type II toxin-antitoxin system HipA family toxin, partial [Victivallales bacterium]|nr:type II toxin-antitoxin system HipA family toxin [Victivallales bacterium]
PPDSVRKRLGKILHLSRNNIFGFLKAIGGDCAGAISLHPQGWMQDAAEQPSLRDLEDDEAVEILTGLHKRPLNLGQEAGFRISGTGAQDKLIACVHDGKIALPLYGSPSTHIIKTPVEAFPHSVHNEFFCMRLAKACGIPVPNCAILQFGGTPYYCVERYDRTVKDGKVVRLHQEDFCQLLATPPEHKYESEGGPSIVDCFKVIRKMRVNAAGQLDFFRRIIFNFIIGNGDAHAKNFSVLYRGKSISIAPAYDLLCTEIYPSLLAENAMAIGGDSAFDRIDSNSFRRMANACGVREGLILPLLNEMTETIGDKAQALADSLVETQPSPVYDKILGVIQRHVGQGR